MTQVMRLDRVDPGLQRYFNNDRIPAILFVVQLAVAIGLTFELQRSI